jgi:REP element-mobilizing transposase RayT
MRVALGGRCCRHIFQSVTGAVVPVNEPSGPSVGGNCEHVLNRGNARNNVFHREEDFQTLLKLIGDACERLPMPVLGWCLLSNHFPIVLWPPEHGDLSRWMQWLLTVLR